MIPIVIHIVDYYGFVCVCLLRHISEDLVISVGCEFIENQHQNLEKLTLISKVNHIEEFLSASEYENIRYYSLIARPHSSTFQQPQ